MGDRMLLELGAQSRAARRVADAVPDVIEVIENLATDIEGAAAGFRGASAGALAEALGEWFTSARALPGFLMSYAAALAAVDRGAGRADATGASGLATGGSGLNMGPT